MLQAPRRGERVKMSVQDVITASTTTSWPPARATSLAVPVCAFVGLSGWRPLPPPAFAEVGFGLDFGRDATRLLINFLSLLLEL
ncbi:hypothetical protein EVAR_5154_1 [Eumeta japonica]|uniref:Uncharacterized protein n=1 Tax=Eumeta variegata TaxID=151549 RepID=A0A4C1SV96_EUMVA|nr:hypothetical protein EVAR_5154_1 [Eumeta japonica]